MQKSRTQYHDIIIQGPDDKQHKTHTKCSLFLIFCKYKSILCICCEAPRIRNSSQPNSCATFSARAMLTGPKIQPTIKRACKICVLHDYRATLC